MLFVQTMVVEYLYSNATMRVSVYNASVCYDWMLLMYCMIICTRMYFATSVAFFVLSPMTSVFDLFDLF